MTKIMFVCHGNICRSPMAEFVMKDIIKKAGVADKFVITSTATSTEALGCTVHRGTKSVLKLHGVHYDERSARQITRRDYEENDYILLMDSLNMRNIMRIIGQDDQQKVYRLLDFAGGGDIPDPWYTGDFEGTYEKVLEGCKGLLEKLIKN